MSAECVAESIPAGYKQTEVGVIPEDWEVRKLEEIADVIDPHPSHRAPPEVTNGIPFVGIGDLNENGEIIASKVRNVAPSVFYEHQKRYDLVEELIGLGRVASIGKVVKIKSIGSRYTISPTLGIIRGTKVKRDYLLYALKSKAVTDQFNKIMSGSTRSAVGMIVLRKLDIFLPTTEKEQESIATALSDTDALIESLEQLIAKKRQIKQGAMQELLTGKRRLPGFEVKHGYKQTEVGVIPEDWIVYALGEIGKFKNGLNKDSLAFGHGSPFVNLMDVFGVNSIASNEQLGLVECTNFEQNIYDLRSGDVIFVRSSVKPSGVGLTIVIEKDLGKTVYSGFLIRFRDDGFIDTAFKKHCFYEKGFRKRIISSSSVSANTNISQDSLKGLFIPLPPTKAEQTTIATILSDMDSEITLLEEKLGKTRQIKQGMMQELLTGRIRLV